MTTTKTALQLVNASTSPEKQVNENFDALSAAAIFAKDATTSAGLVHGYLGGIYNGVAVDPGTITLTASATNYLVVNRATGVVSASTTTTNWASSTYARLRKITTGASSVTAEEDHRFDTNGLLLGSPGSSGLTLTPTSADYTFVLGDANNGLLHPAADTTARTFTVPANASVAFPVGTTLTIVNQHGAGGISIAITTDTLRLAGAGTTGTRALAADGYAVLLKITATEWLAMGTNLT